MFKSQTVYIDVMGIPPCYIEATFDPDARRVYVDGATLATMRAAFEAADLFDAETMTSVLLALGSIKPDTQGRYDVTDQGGDYNLWAAGRFDPDAAPSGGAEGYAEEPASL